MVGPGCGAWEQINNWSVDIPEKTRLDLPGKKEIKKTKSDRLRQTFKFFLERSQSQFTFRQGPPSD